MILFVCSQSFLRSRTAELLCCMGGLEARCAGTDKNALYAINDELLMSAQYIFCMERRHLKEISKMAGFDRRRAVVLNIPDDYARFDPELVDSLIKRTEPFDDEISSAMRLGWLRHKAMQRIALEDENKMKTAQAQGIRPGA